jgi:hypothetical protein
MNSRKRTRSGVAYCRSHDGYALVVERPAEAAGDPLELDRVPLQRAITPGSSVAAPLKMKWSPINVSPAPDGPATWVELPGA